MFLKTFGTSENFTLAKGGYIIKIKPIAKGILLDPFENEFTKPALEGIKYPIPTPKAMAENIQRVR